MSKAFKCDRCKKCFDPWGSEEEDFEFGQIRDYSVITPVGSSFDYIYRDEELHLCPKCNQEFAQFMENRDISEIEQVKLKMDELILKMLSRKNCTEDNEKDGV